jgi:hypothetical protein
MRFSVVIRTISDKANHQNNLLISRSDYKLRTLNEAPQPTI